MRSTLGAGRARTGAVTLPIAATAMLVLAACGSTQPERNTTPPASASASPGATPIAPATSVETSGPAPTSSARASTPALTVESAVESLGSLPAVSRSGTLVAFIDDVSDPSCVMPVLQLVDAKSDATMTRIPLLENCEPPIPERVEDAKKVLASETWSPFDPLGMEEDPAHPPVPTPTMGPLRRAVDPRTVITFNEPVLTIWINGKAVLKKSFPAWSDSAPRSIAGAPCPRTYPILDSAWIEQAARVALVGIRYANGNDMCGEPGPSLHAVRF